MTKIPQFFASHRRPPHRTLKRGSVLLLAAIAVLGSSCNGDDNPLSVDERWLIDARYDHLRCEVYLDRLRDLYELSDTEKDGLMGDELVPGPDTSPGGYFDGPLVVGHDGPLTGGHDGPLTGGHDGPLTGGHDQILANLQGVKDAKVDCWAAVNRLVTKYNCCIDDFVDCKDNGSAVADCYAKYQTCLVEKQTAVNECPANP